MNYQTVYTGEQFWFCFVLMNFIFVLSYFGFKKQKKSTPIWGLICLFCVFAYWSTDYFTFQWIYYKELTLSFRDPLYYYLKQLTFGSYTIFRFIIWGSALIMVYYTFNLLRLNKRTAAFIFPFFFLLTFSYARASLAMACYFLGLVLMLKTKRIVSINGVLFIILSYFAHRSMLPIILFTPIALQKWNRVGKLVVFFMTPIVFIVVLNIINRFINESFILDDSFSSFSESASKYVQEGYGHKESNLKTVIMANLHYFSIYITYFYLVYKLLISKSLRNLPRPIFVLMVTCTFIIIISIVFYILTFTIGLTGTLFYRYLFISYIPLIILLTYTYQEGLCSKQTLYLLIFIAFLYEEGYIGGILYSRFLW